MELVLLPSDYKAVLKKFKPDLSLTLMKLIMRNLYIFILLITGLQVIAQPGNGQRMEGSSSMKGSVTGVILDDISGQPMEYANVVLFSLRDSAMVSGAVTNAKGVFTIQEVPFGPYFIKVKFLGYNEKKIDRVVVNPQQMNVNLKTIRLSPDSKNLQEVEVAADRTEVLFKLDKKVVTIGSNLNADGGTAVDALENTPSVQVDIEGNVTMRGSSNFTVLVDGKPSPFSGSDALEMIPMSTIDKIEIITNPSAKYDPEGTAGIINVITKHKALEGLSALVNLNSDTRGGYGGDILLNYSVGKFNFYAGGNYDNNVRKGSHFRETEVLTDSGYYYTYADGERDGGSLSRGLRLGMDYSMSPSSDLSAVFFYGGRDGKNNSTSNYYEAANYIDTLFSNSLAISERDNLRTKLDLDYKYRFNSDGHELKSTLSFSNGTGNELNETRQLENDTEAELSVVSTQEDGKSTDYQFNLDYTNPFSKTMKLEAGLQSKIEWEQEEYLLSYLDNMKDTSFSNSLSSKYHHSVQALYSTFSHEMGKFGYMLGVRGEYTDRLLENRTTGEDYTINQFDFFPTAHVSYQLPKDQQIQASFARRIQRPDNHALEPFETYRDIYTIWKGNPDLKPEYTNAYELSYQKKIGMSFLSAELFHRVNFNKMERTHVVYDENTMLMTMQNVGKDYSTGGEIMMNLNATKWLTINLTTSAFHYKIDTDLFNNVSESFNWTLRGRTSFRLGKNLRLQIDGNYNSPSVSAQGTREAFYMIGSSVRMNFLDNRLSATLQIRDIFYTARHEFYMETETYSSHAYFAMNGQVVQLNLSYKINNYKEKKKINRSVDYGGSDMEY